MVKTSLIIGTALILGGCSKPEVVTLPQLTEHAYILEQESEEATTTEAVTEAYEPEELSDIYYAYHTLEQSSQRVYLQIWHALEQMADETEVSTLDADELEHVFHLVMADHPELFYVQGYQYTTYTQNGTPTKLTFTGTYSMTLEEMQQQYAQIETAAATMLAAADGATDQYTIVKSLYDALIMATEYDSSAENNQNISSVFLQGRSVCQGYAKAMQYLLQRQGIQSVLVTGTADGDSHAWNLVRVDGDYYYLDATWGDASYSSANGGQMTSDTLPPVSYEYFLVTGEELSRTHQFGEEMTLPDCTATQDNYYIREGCYLDSYSEDALKLLFQNINNSRYVTMKCSDEAVYAQVLEALITNQEIFRYVNLSQDSIAYTTNQSQLIITFWI